MCEIFNKIGGLEKWGDSILQTHFAGKLASQGSSLCRETHFAGKLASQGNLFLFNPTKTVILILVVKNVTCNTKVGGIISF